MSPNMWPLSSRLESTEEDEEYNIIIYHLNCSIRIHLLSNKVKMILQYVYS